MISLLTDINRQHTTELREKAARRRLRRSSRAARGRTAFEAEPLTIRRLDRAGADRPALDRLAGRDSAEIPSGDLLGAESGGILIAAISLRTGDSIADPFAQSAAARETLEIRAAQITGHAVKQVGAPLTRRAHA